MGDLVKKFILSLMLVFGFATNSVDAIKTTGVIILGEEIPIFCRYFDTSLSKYGAFTIKHRVFLDWVELILVEKGYMGITDVFVKHIEKRRSYYVKYIDYVEVTVTYDNFIN